MANLEKGKIYNFVHRLTDAEFADISQHQANYSDPDDDNLQEIQKQVRQFEALLNNVFDATNNNNSNDDINDTIKKHLRLADIK